MDSKDQLPPQYAPPRQQGFIAQQPQQQVSTQQQQGFTQQYVVNQGDPVYPNQVFVVQQDFPVQNQEMFSVCVTRPTSTMIVNQRPRDYIVCSLLTCLFCFFPTGIAALMFSHNSKEASDRNDYNKGSRDGNMAKIFSIISLSIGLLLVIVVVISLSVFGVLSNR